MTIGELELSVTSFHHYLILLACALWEDDFSWSCTRKAWDKDFQSLESCEILSIICRVYWRTKGAERKKKFNREVATISMLRVFIIGQFSSHVEDI